MSYAWCKNTRVSLGKFPKSPLCIMFSKWFLRDLHLQNDSEHFRGNTLFSDPFYMSGSNMGCPSSMQCSGPLSFYVHCHELGTPNVGHWTTPSYTIAGYGPVPFVPLISFPLDPHFNRLITPGDDDVSTRVPTTFLPQPPNKSTSRNAPRFPPISSVQSPFSFASDSATALSAC